MTNQILIDAAHQEEVRVAVIKNNRLEEYDFEFDSRRPIRGNIYLAKVTRVEPSLQAAFVDYGGNRNGFLPFSEIHPNYYQIPVADKEALIQESKNEHHLTETGRYDDQCYIRKKPGAKFTPNDRRRGGTGQCGQGI